MHALGEPGIRIAVWNLKVERCFDHGAPVDDGVDCSFPLQPFGGDEQRKFGPAAGIQVPEAILCLLALVAETHEVSRLTKGSIALCHVCAINALKPCRTSAAESVAFNTGAKYQAGIELCLTARNRSGEDAELGQSLVAGVDCSTQATKVVVVDADSGGLVASGKVANEVFRSGPASETDPEYWWQALAKALVQTGRSGEIAAISVAAQQLGVVSLDANHRPLRRAILWDDTRSAQAVEELRKMLGGPDAWAEAIGTQPMAGQSVASWSWLRRAEPTIAKDTAFIRLPHDFLTERLTGNGVTDRGDASGTGWWSGRLGSYVPEVLDLPIVQVDESMLPRVLGPNEPAGTVIGDAAAHTGLNAGIPVACGTGDNMAAALALAISPGTPVISLGTSGTAYVRSEQASADPSGQVFALASASGDHLPLTCTLNATLAADNLARILGLERDDVAERTKVVVMPYLSGERLPDYPYARGTIAGIDHETTAKDILLAAIEGVAYSLVQSIDTLDRNSSGIEPDAPIVLIGGGAKGKTWQKVIGRLSGRSLLIPQSEELVAWGAAAQAAGILLGEPAVDVARRWNVADGLQVPPRPLDREAIERIAEVRDAAHPLNTKEVFWRLAEK